MALNRTRSWSEGGFKPFLWTEIEAWTRLYDIRPKPWELDVLIELDALWLAVMSKKTVTAADLVGEDAHEEDRFDD